MEDLTGATNEDLHRMRLSKALIGNAGQTFENSPLSTICRKRKRRRRWLRYEDGNGSAVRSMGLQERWDLSEKKLASAQESIREGRKEDEGRWGGKWETLVNLKRRKRVM